MTEAIKRLIFDNEKLLQIVLYQHVRTMGSNEEDNHLDYDNGNGGEVKEAPAVII